MGQPPEVSRMIAANRKHWDDRAELHALSSYYDLDLLRARGPAPIAGPDEAEVGPVAGKALVHLHCHIGTDTLRWAALGAQVTGVDFSARSIEIARALAAEVGLDVRFVESDVHDLARTLGGQFDIVYASYGVICWVPDMARWARITAGLLRPGGFIYIVDGHPFDVAFDPARFGRTGYLDPGPARFEDQRSYTDGDGPIARPVNHRWTHTLGDIVTGFAEAGLRIDFLHEHPRILRHDDDQTGAADRRKNIPASAPGLFSLKATHPAA